MNKASALILKQETQDSLDYLSNHDIKALAYPVLVEEGPLTTTGLARALSKRTGLDLSCAKTYPDTYYQGGFSEISEGPLHRGQATRLFTAIREEIGLAAVGALLDWSELNNISLITTLSSTASKGSRSPVNTIQLLEGMLRGLNVGEITDTRYKNTKEGWGTQHNIRLRRLVDDGLVISEDNLAEFKIYNPKYEGNIPFESLSYGQQKLYLVLQAAFNFNKDEMWTIPRLVRFSISSGLLDPRDEASHNDLSNRLTRVISAANPRYSPGVTDKINLNGRRYKIAPSFENSAADLVERVKQIDTSPSKRNTYARVAREIVNDKESSRRIAQRGLEASPFVNASR